MTSEFRVQRYRKSDREGIFDLWRSTHPGGSAERLIRQWDWKYDHNPFNREAELSRRASRNDVRAFIEATQFGEMAERQRSRFRAYQLEPDGAEDDPDIFLLKKNDHEVLGMICSFPQLFQVGGTQQWVSVECDWIVHPDYRNRHFSFRMANRLRSEYVLGVGWRGVNAQRIVDNRDDAVGPKQNSSQPFPTAAKRLVPLVKPFDWRYLATRYTQSGFLRSAAKLLASGAGPLRRVFAGRALIPGVSVVRIESFDDAVNRLWERACRDYPVMAVRDRRYLNWRFAARPDARYTMLAAVKGPATIGYLIFRVRNDDDQPIGYLVDYLVENRSAAIFSLLLRNAEDELLRYGVKAIMCTVATPPYRGALIRHGYFPVPLRTRGYFGAARNTFDPRLQVFTDLRKWFVTMGDGDLEMSL
ncbi:MAG TPA: GNAT family N-acetyltransferase [Candidatus Binataceae bacterium]